MKRDNIPWTLWDMIQRAAAVLLSRRTPRHVRLILLAGLLYVLSPYDLIPEWIPVFGVLDDLALAAILITWAAGFAERQ